ncbi:MULTISPECIES: transposase [Comamonas]|uniref:transposase n=1 Tax=Comamonas sp. TaxID=34028 RepID=UPI002112E7D5|nr:MULTISPECIES: transposase [Comamonas]UUC96342.1 transposase [Comamonas sp. C11]
MCPSSGLVDNCQAIVEKRRDLSVRAARSGIAQYLQFYNAERPHQAHGQATPDEAYFAALSFAQMQAA